MKFRLVVSRSRGIEHRARGFGAGFLEPVEQIAAALAERQDHVVAGIGQRARDVGAALFQRTGDAFRDFVDAGGDRVRDQCDIVTQVDLHAGNGAAHLFGLADQVVALMGDVLKQRANPHLVVAVGAFKRRDLVGHQRFEFAGARDRAFDAVTHRRDFAADRLSNRYHRVAGGALRLGETDGDLRHRLRDRAQLLAAPGQMRHEIEQEDRREEQRKQTCQRQRAARAFADRGAQGRQEADGQNGGAENPNHRKKGRERVGVAGKAALLDRLQSLTDDFAVVIGGAARDAAVLRWR